MTTTWFFVRLSSFCSSFKTGFFSNFLFEFQVVRTSNRSKFEGPLYIEPPKAGENENCLLVKLEPYLPTMRSTTVCRCVGMQSDYHWTGYIVIVLPPRKPQLYVLSRKLDEALKLTSLQGLALIALQFCFQHFTGFFLEWNCIDNMVMWLWCLSVRPNASSRNLTQLISIQIGRACWGVCPEIY
jgi:hypothetical protein